MAAEVDKATQQANGSNGVAPATLNGLGDQTPAENATVRQAAAGEAIQAKAAAPELATTEPVAPPALVPGKEEPKLAEAVAPAGEAPPAPVAEDNKAVNDAPNHPVEQTAPAHIEQTSEALAASAPVEAPSEPAPAPAPALTAEKPLEVADAPAVASEAPKPNGTVTANGTTTTSKEHEDVEMNDYPAASAAVDSSAAPAPAPPAADSAVEKPVAMEPNTEAVVGQKRKAEEEPDVGDAPESKKAKLDETPADAEAIKPAATDAAPAPAPTIDTTGVNSAGTANTAADGAPAPKKAGRPKKTQKEKVPVSPVGRTLRKTRSQGPVEV